MNQLILPFLALLIPAIILLSLGNAKSPTSTQSQQLIWGGILSGTAFAFFGVACIVGTKLSAQPEITGTLTNLRQFNSQHSHSSQFVIAADHQRTHILSCPYNGSSLQEGQTVFVRYLEFDHSVLYLRVLDGSNAGFSFSQSASSWSSVIMFPISMASYYLVFCGLCKLRHNRHLQST